MSHNASGGPLPPSASPPRSCCGSTIASLNHRGQRCPSELGRPWKMKDDFSENRNCLLFFELTPKNRAKSASLVFYSKLISEHVFSSPCGGVKRGLGRSEEHTSELQSHVNLVCRLLLEKKKK